MHTPPRLHRQPGIITIKVPTTVLKFGTEVERIVNDREAIWLSYGIGKLSFHNLPTVYGGCAKPFDEDDLGLRYLLVFWSGNPFRFVDEAMTPAAPWVRVDWYSNQPGWIWAALACGADAIATNTLAVILADLAHAYDGIGEQLKSLAEKEALRSAAAVGDGAGAGDDKAHNMAADPDTIRHFHKLIKTTAKSANTLERELRTTTGSYYKLCKTYTGEDAIDLIDRAAKSRRGQWPPKD